MAGVLESRKGRGVMKKGPAETAWGRAFKRGHQSGGWSPESLGAGLGHVVAFRRCQGRSPPLSRDPSTGRAAQGRGQTAEGAQVQQPRGAGGKMSPRQAVG